MTAQMIRWPALLRGLDNSPNCCLLCFIFSSHQTICFMFLCVMCLCAFLLMLVSNKYFGMCAPVWCCTPSDRLFAMVCNASYAWYLVVSCFTCMMFFVPLLMCCHIPMKNASETIPPCHASHAMYYAPLHMYNE